MHDACVRRPREFELVSHASLLLLVTLSPGGRAIAPLWPVGRATGPPCRRVLARDLFENKKFYRKVPVAHCLSDRCLSPLKWATGGYFCNLLKRPYIFEILFFLNIKKKKVPPPADQSIRSTTTNWIARPTKSHRPELPSPAFSVGPFDDQSSSATGKRGLNFVNSLPIDEY